MRTHALSIALLGAAMTVFAATGVPASPLATTKSAVALPDSLIEPVVVVRRGVVGPRAVVVRPRVWARPGHYWWRPGGAIAAGAAVGFLTAAAVASWAGAPPAPGMCWYHGPNPREGFWDECPVPR